MKAVLQRVKSASVEVSGQIVGSIDLGLMILLGIEQGDSNEESTFIANKVKDLRIFADDVGKMNKSIEEVKGSILLVSQFTLIADWKKGRRPGFTRAAAPDEGKRLYEHFAQTLRNLGLHVETGIFGADMQVSLINDGPVTLVLEHQLEKLN
jgi:D-tyrosyl-tRNA(Tyr) deacylase